MVFCEYVQFGIHHVAHQSQSPETVVVEHVAVYLVFVDSLCEQLADDEEYLRTVGVVCETSRVGHHSAVYRHCHILVHLLESAKLPYQSEHQFACAARLGVRHADVGIHSWVQMMVDKHLVGRRLRDERFQFSRPACIVEIETQQQVCIAGSRFCLLLFLVVSQNVHRARQPLQKVREHIGHDDLHVFLSSLFQIVCHTECRTDGIAVGTAVCVYCNMICFIDKTVEALYLNLSK